MEGSSSSLSIPNSGSRDGYTGVATVAGGRANKRGVFRRRLSFAYTHCTTKLGGGVVYSARAEAAVDRYILPSTGRRDVLAQKRASTARRAARAKTGNGTRDTHTPGISPRCGSSKWRHCRRQEAAKKLRAGDRYVCALILVRLSPLNIRLIHIYIHNIYIL